MEAVIISKTRMQQAVCVGAVLPEGKSIRLLDIHGHNQPFETDYKIGEIWDLTFVERPETVAPHNEDVLVSFSVFKNRKIKNLPRYLLKKAKVKFWEKSIDNLFNGKIRWTSNGSGYVSERTGVPEQSVGFYIADKDLRFEDKYYIFQSNNPYTINKKLPYVGIEPPIDMIPAGTLVRVSLARWWTPEDVEIEARCYLQVSGWYLDPDKGKNILIAKMDKFLAIENDNIVGVYFFQESDNIENIDIGDEITWLKITEGKAIRKGSNEIATTTDGRTIFYAEKIGKNNLDEDLPF